MNVLANQNLLANRGTVLVNASQALADVHIVCYYFSAHWCPPCRSFTPLLADFHTELKGAGASLEVVFVSSDRSEHEMQHYMSESHGDWLAVPWNSNLAATLKSMHNVTGIPALIVVRKHDGAIISRDGRTDVQYKGPQVYNQWIKHC